uniref:Serpin domain-containing protein n=1 Tax=Leersia perrieri TaxID=77586 RepID=A0A0D9V635_9ORYZ
MELAEAIRDETAMSMLVLGRLLALADTPDANGGKNLAVSPLSLHAALALLGAGAQGETLHQIAAFLGPAGAPAHAALASHVALRSLAPGDDNGGPKVRFANGVWVDSALGLKPAYARVVADKYLAEARAVSFRDSVSQFQAIHPSKSQYQCITHQISQSADQPNDPIQPEEARRQINAWFETATGGWIKDFLPERAVDGATPAVLGNALYFKGAWENKFDANSTRDDVFYLPNGGGHVVAQFMSSGKRQHIACRAGYKVLRLPYARGGGRDDAGRVFSMYIYLPDERHGLPDLLRKLCSDPALVEDDSTLSEKVAVGAFMVPRFTVSYKTNAAETLRDLGLRLPFEYPGADLSGLVESPPEKIVVSAVYHESFVEVNEEGTEAAAATAVVMRFGCAAPMRTVEVVDFVADHPFVFLIKEDLTGVVVFAGQITNPSVSS